MRNHKEQNSIICEQVGGTGEGHLEEMNWSQEDKQHIFSHTQ